MKNIIKDALFRAWYWYISTRDQKGEITFMNYGIAGGSDELNLLPHQEKDRYAIQLYHHVASKKDLRGKSILEVGCGRGGGLDFIKTQLSPSQVTGLDLNHKAIEFCLDFHCQKNARFVQGDAQSLPFEDNAFDVILNVESSHRYPQPQSFFNEVYRVLKPGGNFLFTDFRPNDSVESLESQFKISQLNLEEKNDISWKVLKALDLAAPQREILINRLAPRVFKGLAKKFAATPGTPTYEKFKSGQFLYLTYVLRK